MDGAHDLGGKQGFGPLELESDFIAFPEPRHGRRRAIIRATFRRAWTPPPAGVTVKSLTFCPGGVNTLPD